MPIDSKDYPSNWKEFSQSIRVDRAKGRCECFGECGLDHGGRCPQLNDQLGFCFRHDGECGHRPIVVLTVAHLWQHSCTCSPIKCDNPDHVKAMCQRCHLRYDIREHLQNAARTRREHKRNLELFEL